MPPRPLWVHLGLVPPGSHLEHASGNSARNLGTASKESGTSQQVETHGKGAMSFVYSVLTMIDLIPTRYKSKLRKGLSHPVGAKLISELLAGVRQFPDLTVTFAERSFAITQCEFDELLKSSKRIPVIDIWYRNMKPGYSGSKYDIEREFYTETWELLVFPVPSDMRHRVQEKLTTEGITMLRDWLNTPRPMTWRTGRKTYTLYYDPQEHVVISEEKQG